MEFLLETDRLAIGHGHRVLIPDITLSLPSGKTTAMLGANGAGKSTLMRTLSGELPPLAGAVRLLGRPLSSYSRQELARTISLVTTERVTCGGLTVRQTVETGRYPHTGPMARFSATDESLVEKAMEDVGINHKADSHLADLSDGERQKCFIAKALAQNTPVILLDEPFSFLDTASRIEIFRLLNKIAAYGGKGILLTSHDVTQAIRMADNIWLIDSDRHVAQGAPAAMVESGAIANLFSSDCVIYDSSKNDFILKE